MARSMTSRSSAGHGRTCRPDDAGFTLVESIVAFAIFIVISTAALWWLIDTVKLTGENRDRITASALANQQLEKVRNESNGGQVLDSGSNPVTVHGITYTVKTTLNPISTAPCDTGSSRQLTVSVTWSGASTPIRYDSVLAC